MIDVVAYLTNSYEMLRINQKSPGSLREQGVAGSNPATPTTYRLGNRGMLFLLV
ncbi:uncharacterized protein METZ01_LOCUS425141 [marine metagenome]|uniref:Uncharacterized protein n=1 Tax=marine metagenome TaxID=408172 RepID=A0A382XMA1_9ZZZZ